MIFIHGGDFQYGSASQPIYKSDYLVNTTNVIVALIQYRLGKIELFFNNLYKKMVEIRCTWFFGNWKWSK